MSDDLVTNSRFEEFVAEQRLQVGKPDLRQMLLRGQLSKRRFCVTIDRLARL